MRNRILLAKLIRKQKGNYIYEVIFEGKQVSERIICEYSLCEGDEIVYNRKRKIWELKKENKIGILIKRLLSFFTIN